MADKPEILVRALQLADDAVWPCHQSAKDDLVRLVKAATGVVLDPNTPILGFARRMTGYKRPLLLFDDLDRSIGLTGRYPFQVVMAGKAHPRDAGGKEAIRRFHQLGRQLQGKVTCAFLPNYDMRVAMTLVAAADVWVNTPLPPLEDSGTRPAATVLNHHKSRPIFPVRRFASSVQEAATMARQQTPAQGETVERVMHEFKHGELKTARGEIKVKNPKQAIAIALHEAGASKFESPQENTRNLRRTKEKERRGETYRDEAEGRSGRTARSAMSQSSRGTSGNGQTRAELYGEAKRRNIPGRSKMNKQQLAQALHK